VRLPKEFRFEGDEVYIKKRDEFVVLIPKKDKWSIAKELLMEIEDFTEVKHKGSLGDLQTE